MVVSTSLSLVKTSKDVFEATIAYTTTHPSNVYPVYSQDGIKKLLNGMFSGLSAQTNQTEHVNLKWTFALSIGLAQNIFCTSLTLKKFEFSCSLDAKTSKVLGWGLQFATGLTKLNFNR